MLFNLKIKADIDINLNNANTFDDLLKIGISLSKQHNTQFDEFLNKSIFRIHILFISILLGVLNIFVINISFQKVNNTFASKKQAKKNIFVIIVVILYYFIKLLHWILFSF